MNFNEAVLAVCSFILLLGFFIYSYRILKLEKEKTKAINDMRSLLMQATVDTDFIVRFLDNIDSSYDDFDITD